MSNQDIDSIQSAQNQAEQKDLPRWKRLIKKYGAWGLVFYTVKGVAMLYLIPLLFPNFAGCSHQVEDSLHSDKTKVELSDEAAKPSPVE